jgi:hypothetical protein
MNERQQALLNLLEFTDKPLSRRDIQAWLGQYYPQTSEVLGHDTSARLITKDIQEINADPTVDLIIVSSPNAKGGIRLATREQWHKDLEREKINILKKLKRYYIKLNRANTDQALQFKDETIRMVESLHDAQR